MRKRVLTLLLGLCVPLLALPATAHAANVASEFDWFSICPKKAYYVVGDEAEPIFVARNNREDGTCWWYRSPTGSTEDGIRLSSTISVINGGVAMDRDGVIWSYDGWDGLTYTPPTDTVGVNWYYLDITDVTGDYGITNMARIEVANELYDVWVGDIRITDLSADDVLGDADEGATVTYDPDTHTLRLDSANVESDGEPYAIYAEHDLTIELTGTSTVTLNDPTSTDGPTCGAGDSGIPGTTAAIVCDGSLTVRSADASNPGTLEVADASSSYETESPSAIYATEDMTVRDAIVSASSETGHGIVTSDFVSYDSDVEAHSEKKSGLKAESATISGGSVTLDSTDGIALDVAGNLTAVSDCTLTLDGGKGALAAATFDSGGQNWYQWVTSPIGIPAASLNETYSPAGRTDTYLRIEPVGTLYELTVVGGTGSGLFLARNQIAISADPVNDSSHFSHWEVDPSGAGTLADPSSATTTFTMPGTGMTITAIYEPHTLVHHDAKNPTCIDTGWNAYDECTVCGYSTFEETPITGHSWGEDGRCTVCGAIDPDFAPKIIAGANVTWQKGSDKGLTFTSNAAYGDFQKVQVDGRDVDASNYTVEEGSTIVTLKASYLETLSVGKHTLGIVSQTGTAETEFTIAAAAQETLASTGDASTPLATPLLVLASALVGAGALVLRRSRS